MSPSRQFSKVSPAIWSSKRFRSVGEAARLLLLYLMTCTHQNSTGAFRAPLGYICVDMGWNEEQVSQALRELEAVSLVAHDTEEDEFFVHGWFQFNPPMNGSHAAGTMNLIAKIKSPDIAAAALSEFEAAVAADPVVSEAVKSRGTLADTNYMRGRKAR